MVVGVAARVAQLGLRGLSGGARMLTGKGAGGLLGYVALTEGIKHTIVNPALGATGLYYHSGAAAPPAVPAGGMNQRQQDFMYGIEPGGPFGMYWPWQPESQRTGFMDRQLQQQERIAKGGQDVARYQAGLGYNLGIDSNRTRQAMTRDVVAGQTRIADLYSSRNLAGIQDNNRSRVRIAEIDANVRLNQVYDSNRTMIRVADIGANRDRYVADRSVEVARWSGAPMRIATFGGLMRGGF